MEKCCVTQKWRRKNPQQNAAENVIEESEAINMYEEIEKCEVKRKDWEFFLS